MVKTLIKTTKKNPNHFEQKPKSSLTTTKKSCN